MTLNTQSLSIADIRIDGGTQPRAAISEDTVKDYAGYMRGGKVLPPPDVFFDGVTYWLADGFHRLFAAKFIEQLYLTCTIHPGGRRDAVLFSVGANAGHGLQRTNADKRKAVLTLLGDEEWTKWSNKEIAKRCWVGDDMVSDARRSLSVSESEKEGAEEWRYNGRTNERELASRLGSVTSGVRGLLRRAESQRDRTGNQKAQCVAATVVDIYNKGLGPRDGKRLPAWWKEAESV